MRFRVQQSVARAAGQLAGPSSRVMLYKLSLALLIGINSSSRRCRGAAATLRSCVQNQQERGKKIEKKRRVGRGGESDEW
jgi:hypothetical protein